MIKHLILIPIEIDDLSRILTKRVAPMASMEKCYRIVRKPGCISYFTHFLTIRLVTYQNMMGSGKYCPHSQNITFSRYPTTWTSYPQISSINKAALTVSVVLSIKNTQTIRTSRFNP